ncbi:hypothetical protein ATE84_2906 [Aquimarina sp. MAR_2010_214]|uniref:hypothetical protein n=1 Tax=Aquimarina sp. MAR_2010_214 TaxID=1250026 RepID=UPI000C70915D|nr:hypothetical protein [Aquimarina sp. MAR_2010_214]PKV50839.1 hypothetical protein ATE84_2906 [Aquimarina sp. MAR_2010_214]
MKNLVKLKIAVEELKLLKETGHMSEETYNRELRKVYHEFRKLKKQSLEQELYQEVVEITIQPLRLITPS